MAQSSGGGIGEILPILLIGGAAWVAWSMYQSYEAGVVAAAAAAAPPAGGTSTTGTSTTGTSTTGTTSTTSGSSTPTIVIPAGFSVAPDINGAYKGTVTYNGSPATLDVILSSGQVYNTAGSDITTLLGSANVTTLINAFQTAVNAGIVAGTPGFSGLGQFIAVPSTLLTRKVIPIPARRREFA